MKKKTFLIMILISVLALFLNIAPNKSFAWICSNSHEPKDLFKRYDFVFSGKVGLPCNNYCIL